MATKDKKLKVELYPITEKGAESFVPKEKYFSARAKQLSAKPDKGGLGVEVDVANVKELIKMAAGGIDLAPDSADEMVKAYDLIKADHGKAVDHAEELAAKAEEEEKIKAKAEEEKKSYELKLYESVGDAEVLKSFDQVFDTSGRNRLVIREGQTATDAQLVGALAMGFSLQDFGDWVQGDAVVLLEDRGYENVVIMIAERFKIPYSTLSNKARICRAVPVAQRDSFRIPFNTIGTIVLAKLADKPEDNEKLKKKLLDKANKENWKQTEARQKVREAQGKEPSPAAPGEKNPRYLELNLAALGSSKFLADKPNFSEDTFVVDVKAHKYLDMQNTAAEGEEEKMEEVWLDFSGTAPTAEGGEGEPEQEEGGEE